MHDPLDFERRPLISLLSRKRTVAALVLVLENATRALWRIASWLAFFAALWLVNIPAVFAPWGPPLCLAIFIIGLVWLCLNDLRHIRRPKARDIDRRLEEASALHHRPLSVIEDRLVNPKLETTRKLWGRNRDSAYETIRALRLPAPRAIISRRDPYALRMLAVIFLVIGVSVAGPHWQDRLRFGLLPFSFQGEQTQNADAVTLWITPPEYTHVPQIALTGEGRHNETLDIPAGSTLKIRMNKGFTTPHLEMAGETMPLEKFGDQSWGLETPVGPGEALILRQWPFLRAHIAYNLVDDQPPVITVNGAPEDLPKGEVKLPLKLYDDYGVIDMTLRMTLDPSITDKPLGAPYEEIRAVMSAPGQELEIEPVFDLSWHPWAGLPVIITVEGSDYPGQTNDITPLYMTLPERSFSHPVARQLIEYRKRLIYTPEDAAPNVAFDLEELLTNPEAFQYDLLTAMALRSAASRLTHDSRLPSIASVIELLWDTALRIEEGNLPLAARDLQDAQRRLEQVLANPDATDEEVAQALDEFRDALAEYFQELAREIQRRMAESGQDVDIPPELFQNAIRSEDLAAFLDRLQAEALSGDRDSARELLSQMQQFMDQFNQALNSGMPPQMDFMMEGINELQELIEKQQALLDQTVEQTIRHKGRQQQYYPESLPFDEEFFRRQWGLEEMPPLPQPQPQAQPDENDTPPIDTQANKNEQDALRYILGQLMLETDEQLGTIPEPMQLAEQEMRESANELGNNNPDQSIPHQEQAIAYLQQAMEEMSQQLQQMMQQMTLLSLGGMSRMDPLGRPMSEGDPPGMFPGSRVEIPDEAERKRVQEILRTLRERSGEFSRPDYELDYYRRLMQQF